MKMLTRATLCLGFLVPAGSAQSMPRPTFQPATYSSPSGEYELHVSPSHPDASGEAHVEFRRRGELLWEQDLPFTFWTAVVGEDGGLAGYAYTNGIADDSASGEFIVAILGSDGAIRVQETVHRERSRFIHGTPTPLAGALSWNACADRLLVVVEDPDVNRHHESWWMVRLSDGASLPRQIPWDSMEAQGMDDASGQIPRGTLHVDGVPETPLFLSHWLCYGEESGFGARFLLTDPDGGIVWSLDLPGDYGPVSQGWQVSEEAIHGRRYSVLGAGPRFRIDSLGGSTSVTYGVERGGKGGWEVREVKRERLVPRKEASDAESRPLPERRRVLLESAGDVPFGESGEAPSVVRDLVCFDVDDRGQIGAVRQVDGEEEDELAFDLLSPEGKSLRMFSLGKAVGDHWLGLRLLWLRGNTWLIAGPSTEDEWGGAHALWIDASDGTTSPVPGWRGCTPESLARRPGGGFAVLEGPDERAATDYGLVAYDANGQERWRIGSAWGDKPGLFSPTGMCVTPRGEVVVVNAIRNPCVQVFDEGGRLVRTVDLEKIFGRELSYPNWILALDNGFVLEEVRQPTFDRLGRGFDLQESFDPHFASGPVMGPQNLVRGGDGRIWCADEGAFLELDESFLVRRIVGAGPDSVALSSVEESLVDCEGRVFLADARTGNVHVFTSTGEPISVFESRSGDFASRVDVRQMGPLPNGGIFVAGLRGVEYDATGRRTGTFETRVLGTDETVYVPGTTRRWVLREDVLFLEERNGDVLKRIERTPSGDFFSSPGPMAVAPNGVLAVRNLLSRERSRASCGSVFVYDANGEEAGAIPIPADLRPNRVLAFDGRRVVLGLDSGFLLLTLGGEVVLLEAPGEADRAFFSPNGEELWSFRSRKPVMHRWKLP